MISIHAPDEGATDFMESVNSGLVFQSTLPMRERHGVGLTGASTDWISIHAPDEGATGQGVSPCKLFSEFQSTLPMRERQLRVDRLTGEILISIHAPDEGATTSGENMQVECLYFNPRSR